jgi:hypothetical protein
MTLQITKMLYTTINLLKKNRIYPEHLPELPNHSLDEPIPLTLILQVRGLYDALRALHATTTPDKARRFMGLLVCDYAERTLSAFEVYAKHTKWISDENLPRHAIEIARQFLRGETTRDALVAAVKDATLLAHGIDYDSECEPDDSPIFAARDAVSAAAGAAWVALEAREYPGSILCVVDDTPESEREWQTQHFAELLEKV